MAKITKEDALRYHEEGRPGKVEILPTKPHRTQRDLSLAYSPGVAFPCLEIKNIKTIFIDIPLKGIWSLLYPMAQPFLVWGTSGPMQVNP